MRPRHSDDQGRDLSKPPKLERTLNMAMAYELHPARRAFGTRDAGPSRLVRDAFARMARAWRRYRVERELESMPFDLRKDIGFRSSNAATR